MSVRVVRTRGGEHVICDIREVTSAEEDSKGKILGYQLMNPYALWVSDGMTAEDDEGNIHKISSPEITMVPWLPLAKDKDRIMVRYDEIVTAYETHDEVVKQYNELIGAENGQDSTDEERESD